MTKDGWLITWTANAIFRWRIYDTKAAAKKAFEQFFGAEVTEPRKVSIGIDEPEFKDIPF